MFGPTEEGIIRDLVPNRWQRCLSDFFRAYERAHYRCPQPFPGIDAVLSTLQRRGVRLGIVTGKGFRTATTSLKVFGLAERFDVVETGSLNEGIKPQSMSSVLEKWRLEPRQVASIGDSPSDIRAAQQVGESADELANWRNRRSEPCRPFSGREPRYRLWCDAGALGRARRGRELPAFPKFRPACFWESRMAG